MIAKSSGKSDDGEYSQKEATARFEAALKGAMHTPHTPLKDKLKVKKTKPKKKAAK
jgi:hypothetical protein